MSSTPLALAQHYVDIDRPERALEALDRLSDTELHDAEPWRLRAVALVQLEDWDAAAKVARVGLEHAPSAVGLLWVLSVALRQSGDLPGAERAILAALETAPDDPRLISSYALLVARAGQLDKAERLVDAAAERDPDEPEVLRARTSLAYLRGDRAQQAGHSAELLARDPEDPLGHAMLGVTYSQTGDVGAAARHFETVARQDVTNQDAAEAAREARARTHPLLWPLWPIRRFGVFGSWIGVVATGIVLRAAHLTTLAGVLGICWLVLCVYSWMTPSIVRHLVQRGQR